jgi:hypothetical protein
MQKPAYAGSAVIFYPLLLSLEKISNKSIIINFKTMTKANFKQIVRADAIRPIVKTHCNASLVMIALIIGLVMVSCGGGGNNNNAATMVEQQQEASAKQTEITADNWQREIKKRFGIDLAVPQGWSFADVRVYFSGETVLVIFNRENDNAEKPQDIASKIFDASKAISSDGNFSVDVNSETYKVSKGKVYEAFRDSQVGNVDFFGEEYINAFWYYKKDGVKLISLDCDKGNKFVVKFEISKITV